MNVEKGTPLERLEYKSMESSGLTPLEYLVREQVLGSAAIWSGQQLRASGSKVTEARNFLIISLMTFYLFSIFLELLLNVSVGHPGPLAVLFSPFCVFDYSLEDRGWDGGWHHRVDAHESEQVPGVSDGQGSLVCWHAAVHGVAKSRTQLSDSTELNWEISSNLASTEFVIAAIDLNFLELFCELWMSECSLFKTSHSCVMDEKSFMWLMLSVCVCVFVCVCEFWLQSLSWGIKGWLDALSPQLELVDFHTTMRPFAGEPLKSISEDVSCRAGEILYGDTFHLLAWEEGSGEPVVWELNGRKRLEYLH